MVKQEDEQRLLEFVEENESVNTFRLARELKMERILVIKIVEQLQKKGAVDIRHGKVLFLSHPKEESVFEAKEPKIIIITSGMARVFR